MPPVVEGNFEQFKASQFVVTGSGEFHSMQVLTEVWQSMEVGRGAYTKHLKHKGYWL